MVRRYRYVIAVTAVCLPVLLGTAPAVLAQTGLARSEAQPPIVVPPSVLKPASAGADVAPIRTLNFASNGDVIPSPFPGESKDRGAFGRMFDTIGYWVETIVTTVTNGLTPPSPETFAKSVRSKDPYDFWKLVGDAGYKLKEISTDVGIVPDVGFRFKYVRELSDGDVNWIERRLEHHAEKFKDPLSVVQRTIIYTLLNINSSEVYYVDELKVKLLPLPKAEFSLMPWDSGLSEEHDTLLRAIQGKKRTKRKPAEEDAHY